MIMCKSLYLHHFIDPYPNNGYPYPGYPGQPAYPPPPPHHPPPNVIVVDPHHHHHGHVYVAPPPPPVIVSRACIPIWIIGQWVECLFFLCVCRSLLMVTTTTESFTIFSTTITTIKFRGFSKMFRHWRILPQMISVINYPMKQPVFTLILALVYSLRLSSIC